MIDNIELYRKFLAAAESRSISEAAVNFNISQPALSNAILELEDKLGTTLFTRSSKGISLTQSGEVLYEYIKNALSFIETGENRVNEIIGLKSGLMRIGASDMTLRFYLLEYLEIFRNRYPDVKLKVTNAPTPQTLAALRNGEIDFGVITENDIEAETDQKIKRFGDDICVVPVREILDIFICSYKYPVSFEENVTAERLSEYPVIMLEESTSTRRYIQSVLEKENLSLTPDIELATSDLLLEFAVRGIGISAIVEDFAKEALANGKVKKVNFTPKIPPRHICIAYLKKISLCTAAKEMFRLMNICIPKDKNKN